MGWQKSGRSLRHFATDERRVRKAFSDDALARIGATIAEGEKRHRGQVRFVVEPALPLARVARRISPRERALEVFGLLRIWDTEENCGVLVYLLLADRAVEIVADRGIDRAVGAAAWESVCRDMEKAFAGERYAEGATQGIAAINELLARHFPDDGRPRDERAPRRACRPVGPAPAEIYFAAGRTAAAAGACAGFSVPMRCSASPCAWLSRKRISTSTIVPDTNSPNITIAASTGTPKRTIVA